MNNFNVKNYDENKNYVIQASAGTGKTYNITKIVDKLVNICNFDLHKILIVTYTEKAAGELKDRIRVVIKNQDVDNAPIGTIHSFCQNTIKEFGLSANLPLNLNVIDENEIKSELNIDGSFGIMACAKPLTILTILSIILSPFLSINDTALSIAPGIVFIILSIKCSSVPPIPFSPIISFKLSISSFIPGRILSFI